MSVSEAKRAAITRYNEKCGRIELRPLKEDARKNKSSSGGSRPEHAGVYSTGLRRANATRNRKIKGAARMGGKASAASKNKWNNKTYDRITITVKKEDNAK